jgi:hypothetical protein
MQEAALQEEIHPRKNATRRHPHMEEAVLHEEIHSRKKVM